MGLAGAVVGVLPQNHNPHRFKGAELERSPKLVRGRMDFSRTVRCLYLRLKTTPCIRAIKGAQGQKPILRKVGNANHRANFVFLLLCEP